MSIPPVDGSLALSANFSNASLGPQSVGPRPATPSPKIDQTDLGASQKQQNAPPKIAAANYEPPQDVVEVHQDSQVPDQIVVEYLDQAKNVILQVPSSQQLDFERAIVQEFQQEEKLRASVGATAAGDTGAKSDGNQL